MLSSTTILPRGTTVYFTTTFYDVAGDVVQPSTATINVVFPDPGGLETDTVTVNMTGPTAPATAWTAQWDSRGSGIGAVSWSIHSDPGPPFGVEDGEFVLTGNPANLLTFS